MPGRLKHVNQIITQVEQKLSGFMQTLSRLNDSRGLCQVSIFKAVFSKNSALLAVN
jgi:hypothetical protein